MVRYYVIILWKLLMHLWSRELYLDAILCLQYQTENLPSDPQASADGKVADLTSMLTVLLFDKNNILLFQCSKVLFFHMYFTLVVQLIVLIMVPRVNIVLCRIVTVKNTSWMSQSYSLN